MGLIRKDTEVVVSEMEMETEVSTVNKYTYAWNNYIHVHLAYLTCIGIIVRNIYAFYVF